MPRRVSDPPKTVLIVEDDEWIADAVAGALADEGFVVMQASCLRDARGLLARRHPDVLVLDLELPDGASDGLLDELAGRMSAPPSVLVSASPRAKGVATRHSIALLSKPFDLDELIAVVRSAIVRARPAWAKKRT